jgi:hypothetical protein
MDILLRNALRRNIRRARAVGDLARADRLQQRLEPVPMAKPAAVEVPAPRRRGRPRKETPPEQVAEPEIMPVEFLPEVRAEE